MDPPAVPIGTTTGNSNHHGNETSAKILRKGSNSSQLSGSDNGNNTGGLDRYSPRRVSIAKASNLTVALSGGNPKSKMGTLRRKSKSVFAAFREAYMSVDDGDLTFQVSEDDVDNREVYPLLAIREVKLLAPGSCQFQLKLAEQSSPLGSGSSVSASSKSLSFLNFPDFGSTAKTRCVVLKASSNKEAMEWIATIKHELKNQILVCKNLFSTLQSEGHPERAEPLFEQMIELLRVVYDGREHFEVADTLRSYGKWLEHHGRADEAAHMKKQAKAIKRRCEEGLDSTLSRGNSNDSLTGNAGPESPRRASNINNALPPLLRKS
jgi:hypothetical protein